MNQQKGLIEWHVTEWINALIHQAKRTKFIKLILKANTYVRNCNIKHFNRFPIVSFNRISFIQMKNQTPTSKTTLNAQ